MGKHNYFRISPNQNKLDHNIMSAYSVTKFNKFFSIYLLFLFLFGVYYLHYKHGVGNDTSISEYLINYHGGFVRRGLIGEVLFRYSEFFDLNLRFQIFLFQSFIYSIFLILVFKLFKDFKKSALMLFAIYTPIFLLFPIAELESLGRKETVIYVFFLALLLIKNPKYANIFTFCILPIFCMVYEEIILFSSFIFAVIIIKNKIKDFKSAAKLSLLFLPSILVIFYFMAFPISAENHKIMADSLMNVFGESCYMSCNLVMGNDIDHFSSNIGYIWGDHAHIPSILTRYFFVILIGFFPIFFLSYHSNFKDNIYFTKIRLNNIFLFMLISFIPIIPLYIFGGDWGRWIGMTITFTTTFYFYLYKNNHLNLDQALISKKLTFFLNKRKLVTFIFIIFAFGWNQKTTNVEDVASNPLYKIPYNTAKRIIGWDSFQILQDSPLIKWHKETIE